MPLRGDVLSPGCDRKKKRASFCFCLVINTSPLPGRQAPACGSGMWANHPPGDLPLVAGLEAASPSPQTRPANPLCLVKPAPSRHLHGSRAVELMPRTSRGCPWAGTPAALWLEVLDGG